MEEERVHRARGLVLDIDNTLYPPRRGVFAAVNQRIDLFLTERLSLSLTAATALRRDYVSRYGTTLAGLLRHHGTDPERYLDFVHDLPVEEMLPPDPALRGFLLSVSLPMAVLTNASRRHARRVLTALGVADLIPRTVALEDVGFEGKPFPGAYRTAAESLGLPPGALLFADDVPLYVRGAEEAGFHAFLVGEPHPDAPRSVLSLLALAEPFAGAPWFGGGKGD